MANINLVTVEKKGNVFTPGTLKMFFVLLLVVVLYGGLFFYGSYLNKKTISLKAQYADKHNMFMGSDTKKVMDFQNRLIISQTLIGKSRDIDKDLDAVRAAISSGTYLDSYGYDDAAGTITLNCFANNYDTIAKQILSFKSSTYFSNVSVGDTKLDTRANTVNFSIILTLKNK
jgi:Tfp pilus assembly protein PilN